MHPAVIVNYHVRNTRPQAYQIDAVGEPGENRFAKIGCNRSGADEPAGPNGFRQFFR